MPFNEMLITGSAWVLEVCGIVAIAVGALFSSVRSLLMYLKKGTSADVYARYRRQLSKAILLGLEFLVAADIIRTVAIEPTFRSVGVLAGIVLIRTFLSFTLEVEISGRWPWSHGNGERPDIRETSSRKTGERNEKVEPEVAA
ncbi:DUF1622 domain-containing protein [Geobacter sp. DSM 9736]|uniref:DUF1622 domain-containing protein n=1 Tax=Geobacter sp. DSM 9736 TaxID=1277350 RepID=UPI000B5129F0|nr:DUF1622 domain-containing protein [Geobacter sp. DSM 9736]SNB46900.1 Uncharacterized membrane protein [Geobacter sp. DSM 9736]